jgi:hypothetical protein
MAHDCGGKQTTALVGCAQQSWLVVAPYECLCFEPMQISLGQVNEHNPYIVAAAIQPSSLLV